MTWIIHRSNRNKIYNTDVCRSISKENDKIILEIDQGQNIVLNFENLDMATQSYGYILESIKRGDKLTSI